MEQRTGPHQRHQMWCVHGPPPGLGGLDQFVGHCHPGRPRPRPLGHTTRTSWTTDVSVSVNGHTLVIEYDGAYWHRAPAKVLVDERKSRDLLAAGCLVVRLREDDLPALGIDHPRYREVRVHSTVARSGPVMEDIHDWVMGLTA